MKESKRLSFYHPNPNGAGSAITFELKKPDEKDGYIRVSLAYQTNTSQMLTDKNPIFDWHYAIKIGLNFVDLSKVLMVIDGKWEGFSLPIRKVMGNITTELMLSRKQNNNTFENITMQLTKTEGFTKTVCAITLNSFETFGLSEVIKSSLRQIAFGF